MSVRIVGVTVMPEFFQNEGVDRVLDNLQKAGCNAFATSPYVMQPADDFVADLVGANDVLRRLSLIRVADVLQPVDIEARETIPADADLRAALAQLMELGTTSLAVVDDNKSVVGSVNLGTIEQASKPAEPVASA